VKYVKFGRTGLEISVAGLGCGGHSRLGQGYGTSRQSSSDVVRAAIDLGINYIDTAAAYGTEEIVGDGIQGLRDRVVISTKAMVVKPGTPATGDDMAPARQVRESLEQSLTNLGTDYIDVFHLHGVMPKQYDYCQTQLVPELLKFRNEGKIRYLGLTERFIYDPAHATLSEALQDNIWDVMMVGFNMLNPSARERVFAKAVKKGVGTLVMFAVRKALSNPDALQELLQGLIDENEIDGDALNMEDPLGFLVSEGQADSVIDGAYRFCQNEPGADVVLTGTGSIDHLRENVSSIINGPIAAPALQRLQDLFGHIDSVSGD